MKAGGIYRWLIHGQKRITVENSSQPIRGHVH